MAGDRFSVQKKALNGYAVDIGSETNSWVHAGNAIKGGVVDASAFTNEGARIANAYSDLVADYSWYAWRIGTTLDKVAGTLHAVARRYGEAEAVIKDNINDVGKQF
ncbi:MAG: hypothetical protein ACJ72W_15010 [Actinoallomurus sp.]